MPDLPPEEDGLVATSGAENGVLRLSLDTGGVEILNAGLEDGAEESDKDVDETIPFYPEIRLVGRDDPEAYSFNTPLFSAHKLPKDVVDASSSGEGGIRDFLNRWESQGRDSEGRVVMEDDDD